MENIHEWLDSEIKQYANKQHKFYGAVPLAYEAMVDAGNVGAGLVLEKLREYISQEIKNIDFASIAKCRLQTEYNKYHKVELDWMEIAARKISRSLKEKMIEEMEKAFSKRPAEIPYNPDLDND